MTTVPAPLPPWDVERVVKEDLAELGLRVVLARRRRNWSQLSLAERAGISRTTLSRVEGGASTTTMAVLYGLARALDLTPAQLLTGEGL